MMTTTATKTSLIKLELNSKGLYQSSGKTQENCCFAFQSSTKLGTFTRRTKKGDARAKLSVLSI